MNIPADLKYTKDHEWVKVDGDIVTIGVTDFAQKELGKIDKDVTRITGESMDIAALPLDKPERDE